eukprot:TRINITY_DN39177_c0_g1_i2.p1 TRINITY_DN39177_c0_g1~~TRINITY_DN39177_c0_g1_i2.p1  ORF type:complete len:329 (-),score=35.74 TRINITY_DN39177_c0_g1_i2:30-1016(-)
MRACLNGPQIIVLVMFPTYSYNSRTSIITHRKMIIMQQQIQRLRLCAFCGKITKRSKQQKQQQRKRRLTDPYQRLELQRAWLNKDILECRNPMTLLNILQENEAMMDHVNISTAAGIITKIITIQTQKVQTARELEKVIVQIYDKLMHLMYKHANKMDGKSVSNCMWSLGKQIEILKVDLSSELRVEVFRKLCERADFVAHEMFVYEIVNCVWAIAKFNEEQKQLVEAPGKLNNFEQEKYRQMETGGKLEEFQEKYQEEEASGKVNKFQLEKYHQKEAVGKLDEYYENYYPEEATGKVNKYKMEAIGRLEEFYENYSYFLKHQQTCWD